MYEGQEMEETERLNVEKIINLAFGPFNTNLVDFKLLRTIFHVLAHRLNMLEQDVEIRLDEREDTIIALKKKMGIGSLIGPLEPDDESDAEMSERKKMAGEKVVDDNRGKRDKKGEISQDISDDKLQTGSDKRSKSKKDRKMRKGGASYDSTSDKSGDEVDEKGHKSGKGKYEESSKRGKGKRADVSKTDDTSSSDAAQDDKMRKKRKKRKSRKEGAESETSSSDDKMRKGERKRKSKKGKVSTESSTLDQKKGKSKDDSSDDDDKKSARSTKSQKSKRSEDTQGVDQSQVGKLEKDKGALSAKEGDSQSKERGMTQSGVSRRGGIEPKDTFSHAGRGTPVRGSIELATLSDFELLESEVKKLMQKTRPVPSPSMPDNKMIKSALSRGTSTLTGAMEAMQLNARVRAAEEALSRMADLLAHLAESGALPDDMMFLIDQLNKEHGELSRLMEAGEKDLSSKTTKSRLSRKSVKPGVSLRFGAGKSRMGPSKQTGVPVAGITPIKSSLMPPADPLVTPSGLSEAIENMTHEMLANMTTLTEKSTAASEQASLLVKAVETKLVTALAVNTRIRELDLMTTKHAEQLTGFDAGLTAQNLTHWVSMVGDDKVDREDLMRGLQEKVDKNCLTGLLNEDAFEVSRIKLTKQLDDCFNMFYNIDRGWLKTLKNLKETASNSKALFLDLYVLKDFATTYLTDIRDMVCKMEDLLGDPVVAKLTRYLSRAAYCGSCMVAAQMAPFDKTYGKPPELPALNLDLYPRTEASYDLLIRPPDERKYICRRWVGGSHTIMTQRSPQPTPQTHLPDMPTKRYFATAGDGHNYMMEENLKPCDECKDTDKPAEPPLKEIGDEDHTHHKDKIKTVKQKPADWIERIPTLDDEDHEHASILSIVGSSILNA